jgi:hypothetical protein
MELSIMQADQKNIKSSRLQGIFGRSESNMKYFRNTRTTGDEWILGNVRNYS